MLRKQGVDAPVCLTDHDPNIEALEWARKRSGGALTYHPEPVDAVKVPAERTGLRTMFQAFHHLRPDQARAALACGAQSFPASDLMAAVRSHGHSIG